MYKLKKVILDQNGMNRIGYFIYDKKKVTEDPTEGFIGGFVVKIREGEYEISRPNHAFNYGKRIGNIESSLSVVTERAEHYAQEFLLSLYKKQREAIFQTRDRENNNLESVASE